MGTNFRFSKAALKLSRVAGCLLIGGILLSSDTKLLAAPTGGATPQPSMPPLTIPTPTPSVQGEIDLGEELEKEGLDSEAEKAYEKAFEDATPAEMPSVRQHLQALAQKKKSFKEKYARSSWDDLLLSTQKASVGVFEALLLALLVVISRPLLKKAPWYLQQSTVEIADFIDGAGDGAATAFREHMRRAVEQVREFYKPRSVLHFAVGGSLILLVGPPSEGIFDIASEVVPGPVSKAFLMLRMNFSAPRYKITGVVHRCGMHYAFLVRFSDGDEIVKVWEIESQAFNGIWNQQQLAYQVALRLKEYIDDRRNT